ncbi:MAG: GDP-mannose 4,6-dehydratase [Sulfuricaulis sp.]
MRKTCCARRREEFRRQRSRQRPIVVGRVHEGMESINVDIRDMEQLQVAIKRSKPDIAVHIEAQSLVCYLYQNSIDTYSTNVMGTVNVLEAVRRVGSVKAWSM